MVKVAFIASLQGFPEEWDTDTEDATRIANRAAQIVQSVLPGVEVTVFDRTDYIGQGDVYVKARDDAVRWGADVIVSVHQDAGEPGARGFTVLYYDDIAFARVMDAAMHRILDEFGVPGRPLMPRECAVLKLRESVLVEAGFYTSSADELVGTEPYARGIALGTIEWLRLAHGVGMEEGMEEMTARIGAPIVTEHHFPDVWLAHFSTYYLHMQNRGKNDATVEVFYDEKGDDGAYGRVTEEGKPIRLAKDGAKGAYQELDVGTILRAKVGSRGVSVSVHSTQPIVCILREI